MLEGTFGEKFKECWCVTLLNVNNSSRYNCQSVTPKTSTKNQNDEQGTDFVNVLYALFYYLTLNCCIMLYIICNEKAVFSYIRILFMCILFVNHKEHMKCKEFY